MATEFAWWSTSNSYGTYTYALSYDLLSQSTTNNTSTIRVYGVLKLPVYISWSRGSATVHTSSFGLATYYGAGNHTIGSVDITVGHNNDGTGSVYVGGSINTSYLMNGSCGGTIYLPRIPRAATINSFTGTDINKAFRATYTTKGSGFTYKLRISIPGVRAVDTFNNYASGTNVYLSKAGIDYLKNYTRNKTIVLGGVIETWSGGTKIGESSEINITCNIRRDMYIKVGGTYKRATAYVRIGNQWKEARPYLRINNQWKEGI